MISCPVSAPARLLWLPPIKTRKVVFEFFEARRFGWAILKQKAAANLRALQQLVEGKQRLRSNDVADCKFATEFLLWGEVEPYFSLENRSKVRRMPETSLEVYWGKAGSRVFKD